MIVSLYLHPKCHTKRKLMHFAKICQKLMVALSHGGNDRTALLDAAEWCKETDEYRYTGDHSTEDEADLQSVKVGAQHDIQSFSGESVTEFARSCFQHGRETGC